jgi:hypothetical protein
MWGRNRSTSAQTTDDVQEFCYTRILAAPLICVPASDNKRTQSNDSLIEIVDGIRRARRNSPSGYRQTARVSSEIVDRSCGWSGRGGSGSGSGAMCRR